MKRCGLMVVLFGQLTSLAYADVSSVAISRNGGSATSTGVSYGGADVEAHAEADGGVSESFAEGRGNAILRSVAQNLGRGRARVHATTRGINGGQAIGDFVASSLDGGDALVDGSVVADGDADVHGSGTALSEDGGTATTRVRASGRGFNSPRTKVIAEGLAHDHGYGADADVEVDGVATDGNASAEAVAVADGRQRFAKSKARANARALRSVSKARAVEIND